MTLLNLLYAAFKAVPILKQVWDQLVAEYIKIEYQKMKDADREAIRKAVNEKDQRELETLVGSSKAGKPSGLNGTSILDPDDLPGVGRLPDKGKN